MYVIWEVSGWKLVVGVIIKEWDDKLRGVESIQWGIKISIIDKIGGFGIFS